MVLGAIASMGKLSPRAPLRWIANTYVDLARGIPALTILFLLYFGLVAFNIVLAAGAYFVLAWPVSLAARRCEGRMRRGLRVR